MFKKFVLLSLVILSLFGDTNHKKETKNVLVLHSYHQTSNWVANIQKGIDDNIDRKDFNINMYIENMDTKRFNSKQYYQSLKNIYKLKYKDIKFDAIIVSDNNALNFLKKYRDELFGDIPVSFCGINFFKTSDLKGYHNYTGVAENEDFDANIKIIKKLFPNIKTIYITADFIISGKLVKEKIRRLIKQNNYNLKFIFSPNKPFSNLLDEIKHLEKNSAILYGTYFKDSTGKYLSPNYTSKKIISTTDLPVFTMFDLFLQNGVLGGNMISSYSQGKEATKILNKILKGKQADNIPVKLKGTNKNIFDFRAMSKYNITESELPKDSIIINKNSYIFTKDELDWILKHPKVIVGGEMDWEPFDFVNKYGDYDGITNDILNIISKKTGLKFQMSTNLSWSELLAKFKKGDLDILPAIYYSKQRAKMGKFTKAYINIQEEFFVLNSSNYTKPSDLKNATFAGIKGYANIQQIKNKFPNIKVIEVSNINEAIKMLEDKKVDVFIGGKIVVEHILKQKNIKNIRSISQTILKTQELKMLIQKEKKELYNIIEKSLENISEEDIINIKKKWSSSKKIFFTQDEKQWIETHKKLKIVIDPHFLPFSGYIGKDHIHSGLKPGFHGISVDLVKKILSKIGIKAEFIKTHNWAESLNMVKDGKADIITSATITPNRQKYLRFTKSTISAPRAIATYKTNRDIHSIEDLKGKRVGLIKDSATMEELLSLVNLTPVIYNNIENGLDDLDKHKIDAFVDNFYVLAFIIADEAYRNINLVHKFDLKNSFHLALSKQTISHTGVGVLNKAIDSLTKAQKNEIKKRWSNVTVKEEIDYTILIQIISIFIFFLLGTLYWARKLKIANNKAQKANLATIKAKKEIESILKHVQDSINYASLIQSAITPSNTLFKDYFKEYFIIWEPKNVVGGDIYLFEELKRDDKEVILMVIDCTGHGVPGAFVTMLVKAIEQQLISIINNNSSMEISPAWILSYFNKTMKQLLHQDNKHSISNAGFDGQVIYYNQSKKILKTASARNEIFYIQDDNIYTIKGDRHSIGYRDSKIDYKFKDNIIDISKETTLYISSDGFWDQNGGENGFCYGKKRLKNLILENKELSLDKQKTIFIDSLLQYQQQNERNDDITFIGLKIDPNHIPNKIIISYKFTINTQNIDMILDKIDNEFNKDEQRKKLQSKIRYLSIEMLQNILHYSTNKTISESKFEIGYNHNKQKYYISSSNQIEKDDIPSITKKIEYINSLDKVSLKQYFKELLKTANQKHEKGAGIGFVEMAKKSTQKIEYNIENISNKYIFNLTIFI